MFELLGICLILAAALTLNTIAALIASALWRSLRGRALEWPAETRASLIFTLRVFPPVIAIISVATLLLPAYITHEPRREVEPVSLKLGILAAISALGLLLAFWRGVQAWIVTRRLTEDWLSCAEPINFDQLGIPAYRLRHRFPVIAIVGAVRTKLFIADHLFESLTREEIAAAIAHENGHLASRDNLKRALLGACRYGLAIVPNGRSLDRAWAEASEAAADEFASRSGSYVALELASALVKIARLVPEGTRPAMPSGALLIGDSADEIAKRVRRLTQLAAHENISTARRSVIFKFWSLPILAATSVSLIMLATDPSTLLAIHNLIEFAVSKLQ